MTNEEKHQLNLAWLAGTIQLQQELIADAKSNPALSDVVAPAEQDLATMKRIAEFYMEKTDNTQTSFFGEPMVRKGKRFYVYCRDNKTYLPAKECGMSIYNTKEYWKTKHGAKEAIKSFRLRGPLMAKTNADLCIHEFSEWLKLENVYEEHED